MLNRLETRWMRMGAALALLAAIAPQAVLAADRTSFNVAWSIYVGWMPWDYAEQSGILKKWAAKYGIKIKLTQVNDYVESINQYTAGSFDACAMTNMDMLTIPAAGGVDSTALISRAGASRFRTSRARKSTWSSFRCRTSCWCAP